MTIELLIVVMVALILLGTLFRRMIALFIIVAVALVLYYVGFFDVLFIFLESTIIQPIHIQIGK